MRAGDVQTQLKMLGSKERADIAQRFFKTGPGEYGEGDKFLGIRVPDIRRLVAAYQDIPMKEVKQLLKSAVHEERLFALLVLVRKYSKGSESDKKQIYNLYLRSTKYINSWDLVDVSAEHIVGAYLVGKSTETLDTLAKSGNLWERRISIMSTYHFIKRGDFTHTVRIAGMLLSDEEDLIHKAVGWMLREIGKRHLKTEEGFLKKNYRKMPRTMLRYAIEKFPEAKRQRYLRGKI
ncbi:MAG: DNA alkylation repair protein [Candidatus Latescibacteria bacterium]|nr:DNA alkylation repair protein [Candidatus Latescibacterota bacterium]NIO28415.1 DNA alkylation repair protein [Candidatus Latescibacterota bacterium]NIO55964.1 DNA alkylation repair protein [Candidatus Latescibacterota bacterium]NIT01928.1 DNA alkylation repair protein [Candidatus Latescibacterota bacterium]